MDDLIIREIDFEYNGEKVNFKVAHNLPDTFGASMDDALTNWMFRTDKLTCESLIAYIDSKNTGVTIMSYKDYLKKLKE